MGKTGCYRIVYLHFWLFFFSLFHGFAESGIKCSYLMLSMITKLLSAQPCQSGCSRKGQCWPVTMPPAFLAPADKTVQLCSELAQKIDPVFPETSPQHRFFFFNFLIQLAALAFNAHTALSAHSHMQRERGPALWQWCGMLCPGHLLQQKWAVRNTSVLDHSMNTVVELIQV